MYLEVTTHSTDLCGNVGNIFVAWPHVKVIGIMPMIM